MSEESKLANPAPLGLMGFGMTTVLLNIHNAGYIELGSMILAMGIFYGGMAQLIAGWWEMKQGNTFPAVAFSSYGLFWLSFVGLETIPTILGGFEYEATGIAAYLAMWGLFTGWMFLSTLKMNRALQVVFSTLTILFFLLAIGFATGSDMVITIAGFEGILCGFSAVYTALAEVTNEYYEGTIFPVYPVE
ncbi:MAG: acetate uptake transporter [Candidatus Thermoplasmatota archaeon]|nr:acetate uptake transporter [Candidatus Thermoplasmatota archaeon]